MSDVTGTDTRRSAITGAGSPKPPADRKVLAHPGRFAIVALGLAFVASLVAIAIVSADTTEVRHVLPPEVQSFSPAASTIVPPQTPIVVDVRDDLTARFVVVNPDGRRVTIPDDEVTRSPGIEVFTFQPGPGKSIGGYEPGPNQVIVYFQRIGDDQFRDVGSYSWTFTSKS